MCGKLFLSAWIFGGLQAGLATALSRGRTKRTTKNSLQHYEAKQNSDWPPSSLPLCVSDDRGAALRGAGIFADADSGTDPSAVFPADSCRIGTAPGRGPE